MNKLLSHPGFRLIYVEEDGHMSLITPLEHKEAIKNGYRCISHLWGNATRWHNHPVHDVEWGVEVREEKRDKLLQIFNHFKGYWWMDVFCTDQDSNNKPLSIMGDVYENCKECVCLLDINIPYILNQPKKTWIKSTNVIIDHMTNVRTCKWNKRVWTFQEWILPPKILYTEEIGDNLSMVNPDILRDHIKSIGLQVFFLTTSNIQNDALFERRKENQSSMIKTLMKSGRECKNPEDYYYGIAGAFGISLRNGLPLLKVEKEFFFHVNQKKTVRGIFRIKRSYEGQNPYETWEHYILPVMRVRRESGDE
jgi:hypothetical protein